MLSSIIILKEGPQPQPLGDSWMNEPLNLNKICSVRCRYGLLMKEEEFIFHMQGKWCVPIYFTSTRICFLVNKKKKIITRGHLL